MNKQMFDMIQNYANEVNKLYFKLEEMFNMEKAEELIGSLDKLEYKFLGFEENEDLSKIFETEPKYIIEQYENIPKYLKLHVIRECEDDMVLCSSTAETFYLVPKNLLADIEK
jgi:hypothetical protein